MSGPEGDKKIETSTCIPWVLSSPTIMDVTLYLCFIWSAWGNLAPSTPHLFKKYLEASTRAT